MGSEKIVRLQESLIKGYKKEIDILEKENANLREMLERQNVIISLMRDVSLMSRLQLRAICLMLRVPAFWTSSLAAW